MGTVAALSASCSGLFSWMAAMVTLWTPMRAESSGNSSPPIKVLSPFEVWAFRQSFFFHQCVFGTGLICAFLVSLRVRISGDSNSRLEARFLIIAIAMFFRWTAHRASDQRFAHRMTIYVLYSLGILRMANDYFMSTTSSHAFEDMNIVQIENAVRPFVYLIIFPSFAPPTWTFVLMNLVLAVNNFHSARAFVDYLGELAQSSNRASDTPFFTATLQLQYCAVQLACCLFALGAGLMQDQRARALHSIMVQHQRECEHTMAATQRAVESEHRARELERMAYEESLHLRNKYVGSMSHDFGTPVAVLKMLLGLMHKRIKADEENVSGGTSVEPTGGRLRTFEDNNKMLDLVRRASAALELLEVIRQKAIAYSKLQSGFNLVPTMANFSLSKLLEKVASVARDTRKTHLVQVEVMITTGVPDKLRSDEGWLFMMLINLASNSIKHTPMGTVTLCASTAGDSRLRLEVRDTGNGVPAHFVPQLFQAFSSATTAMSSVESTGLGLYHSKQLAVILEGDLHYRPNTPRGAVFTAEVPLLPPTDENEEPSLLRLR